MRGDDEAAALYLATAFAWSAGDVERRMPGGENGVEALGRFDSVVAEAADSGAETVAMVSHGAAIRMWVAARAANVDVAYASSRPLGNTAAVVLSGSPDQGWQTLVWGRPAARAGGKLAAGKRPGRGSGPDSLSKAGRRNRSSTMACAEAGRDDRPRRRGRATSYGSEPRRSRSLSGRNSGRERDSRSHTTPQWRTDRGRSANSQRKFRA